MSLSRRLIVRVLILLLSLLLIQNSFAQGPARPTPQSVVKESNRQELDSLLMRKPITAKEENSIRQAMLKQINDDFRDLQTLNNKMMKDVASAQAIDYKSVAEVMTQIRSKATRLNSNLALPKAPEAKGEKSDEEIVSETEFRTKLSEFDQVIVSFTTNPLFQKANVMDLEQANKASRDLSTIINRSAKLKKVAGQLSKKKSPG